MPARRRSGRAGRRSRRSLEGVAAEGFAATTVGDVVEHAGVSRKTFYEHFADKEACFLAAFDSAVSYVLSRLGARAAELGADAGWRERTRSDLEAYIQVLTEEPASAWALHIGSLAAGEAVLARRAEIFAVFSARTRAAYDAARAEDPARPELPAEAFVAHTGGVDELVRGRLRTRGAGALAELVGPVERFTLALFGDR